MKPRLARKVACIGDETCVTFAMNCAASLPALNDLGLATPLPQHTNFRSFVNRDNKAAIFQSIPILFRAIEDAQLGEQHCRTWKRIALANFYSSYDYAQKNTESLLEWYEQQRIGIPPKGNAKEIASQYFLELFFPPTNQECAVVRQQKLTKIQTWRQYGKPWAELVSEFGYGILLLVPMNLTDEEYVVLHLPTAKQRLVIICAGTKIPILTNEQF